MNICFFAHHSISGKDGASLSMINIAEALAIQGNKVYIVYPNRPENVSGHQGITNIYLRNFTMRKSLKDHSGISSMKFRVKKIYNYIICFVLKKKLKNLKLDVIHINGIDNNVGALTALQLKIPYVWHIRQFLEEDLNCTIFHKRSTYRLMKKADFVIGISKAVCEKYERILGRKVELIYNGVEPNDYILPHHAFEKKPYCIILPGRITKEKGQLDAVKAVKILLDKGYELKLRLVGYGIDRYYEFLKDYVTKNGLSNYVEFMEYTDNLKYIREQSDIGVVCSVKEAFGRVTVENFFSRIICVGANSGGTAELIKNQYNGLLYENGNINDLADKIEYLLDENNRSIVNDMLQHAYDEAVNKFSTERVVNQILLLYASLKCKNE
ncbi:glycosyltransferase family 4 protein [Sporofaciens musculi]|uniref:glycosyltransferase family 4 protein n=1 Tax=Sporofaciens musculi TaxID=2681861 RepID=UPI002590A099|nr:glycosyltransferase family 4 protein [Sporofaciens musculi]